MTSNILTRSRLRQVLHYCPNAGVFTWRVATAHRITIGDIAGAVSSRDGYRLIGIDGATYRASRLAFLYMECMWPKDQMDHINHVRDDDRWSNLREVDDLENRKNQSLRSDNTSGVIGVYWSKSRSKWSAQININGEIKHLGRFEKLKDASNARKQAEFQCGYHHNHGA